MLLFEEHPLDKSRSFRNDQGPDGSPGWRRPPGKGPRRPSVSWPGMLDLGPTKLLLIFVVIVVLLGPDKLPQVARQLGSGWRRLRQLQERMETELRETVPDLPSTQEIARFARSPMTLLSRLSDLTEDELAADPGAPAPGADPAGEGDGWPEDRAVASPPVDGLSPVPMTAAVELPDDPSMN